MDIFFWRKNPLIDTFASNLANDVFGAVQPQMAEDYFTGYSDKKQAQKIHNTMEKEIQKLTRRIIEFKTVNGLGIYGKARLHMKFRERLKELGYSSNAAVKLNEIVMLKTP